ncbi:hypothetical protein [Microbacterium aurantiacum]|uniref:hypothetical protein n=1 Tax=Microbacterium aurantiacum TaxID=162393 RepID=UPI00341E24D8
MTVHGRSEGVIPVGRVRSEVACRRCGEPAETRDNIAGTNFWGLIQRKTETIVRKSIRVAATHYKRTEHDRSVLRSDEEIRLCDPCWGEFIGHFLQGREVVALDHVHFWRRGREDGYLTLEHCSQCYRSRVAEPAGAVDV